MVYSSWDDLFIDISVSVIYIYIYIYIYIVIHRQTFVLSELFSEAWHVGRSKPGSKPAQHYVKTKSQTAWPTCVPRLAKGIVKVLCRNKSRIVPYWCGYAELLTCSRQIVKLCNGIEKAQREKLIRLIKWFSHRVCFFELPNKWRWKIDYASRGRVSIR